MGSDGPKYPWRTFLLLASVSATVVVLILLLVKGCLAP